MARKNCFGESIIEKEESLFHEVLEMAFIAIAALFVAIVFGTYVTMTRGVAGFSMRPTYNNAAEYTNYNETYDSVRITRIGAAKRGDVIVFMAPKMSPPRLLIKRVIGVGGDTLEFRQSGEYAGTAEVWRKTPKSAGFQKVDEPYINRDAQERPLFTNIGQYSYGEPFTVPQNCYFVMGDNRNNSTDSRSEKVGFVPKGDIDGRVYLYVPKGDSFIAALWREVFG